MRDPVCRMSVDVESTLSVEHGARIYSSYFCSDGCRSEFEAAPERFVSSAAVPQRAGL